MVVSISPAAAQNPPIGLFGNAHDFRTGPPPLEAIAKTQKGLKRTSLFTRHYEPEGWFISVGAYRPSPQDIFEWWEWALAIPDVPSSPHPGKGGDIHKNQTKRFFCHVCTFGTGSDPKRKYKVRDETKQLMIPVLTSEASLAENPRFDDNQLLNKASYDLQNPELLFLNVDGSYVLTPHNADQYYVESPADDVTPVKDNILGLPATKTRMRCLGYFVLLDSLGEGRHDLTFGGSAGPPNNKINTLVSYEVTV